MEHHVDMNAAPGGVFVPDRQGRFYFLRNEEAKRYTVFANDEATVEKLWTGSSPVGRYRGQ